MSIRSRSSRGFRGKLRATKRTSIKILFSCLLFVLLSGAVVSPWHVNEAAAAASSVGGDQKVSTMTQTSTTPQAQAPQATTSEMKPKMKSTSSPGSSERKPAPTTKQQNKKCDYDKGQWNECEADGKYEWQGPASHTTTPCLETNRSLHLSESQPADVSTGSQQKIMRLKAGGRSECKPSKTIRRDCKTAAGEFLFLAANSFCELSWLAFVRSH